MSRPTIHLTRLAVTMTRDRSILRLLLDISRIKGNLLYVGVPIDAVDEIWSESWYDPSTLAHLLDTLHKDGRLSSFLTEMLRTVEPDDVDELRRHLQPLGLDLDEDACQIRFSTTHPEADQILRTQLDTLLSKIDVGFPQRLRGAWDAYYSDNPDRYRQAVTSCRELLTDVTQKLGGKGTRRQRIEQIFGMGSRAEVVDAAAGLVDALYGVQSAQQHDEPDQTTALFALAETEHVLYFLLTRYSSG